MLHPGVQSVDEFLKRLFLAAAPTSRGDASYETVARDVEQELITQLIAQFRHFAIAIRRLATRELVGEKQKNLALTREIEALRHVNSSLRDALDEFRIKAHANVTAEDVARSAGSPAANRAEADASADYCQNGNGDTAAEVKRQVEEEVKRQKLGLIHVIQHQLNNFINANRPQLLRDYPFLGHGPVDITVDMYRGEPATPAK